MYFSLVLPPTVASSRDKVTCCHALIAALIVNMAMARGYPSSRTRRRLETLNVPHHDHLHWVNSWGAAPLRVLVGGQQKMYNGSVFCSAER